MTLEQQLYAILTTSPLPIPAIGLRWFPVTAEQNVAYPYAVYSEVSGVLLAPTQDQPALAAGDTLTHRYQFSLFGQDYDQLDAVRVALVALLQAVPRAQPGIQSILLLNLLWGPFDDADRLFHRIVEFTVIENC